MATGKSGGALAALAVLTLLWGYTWIIAKQALDYAGPFHVGFLRTALATIVLFGALLALRRPLRPRSPGKTLIVGLFQTGGFIALSTWALVEGGAGKTAVLVFTMPVWTLLLARLVLGERIRASQWLAAACTLAGLLLIVAPWNLHATPLSKLLAVLAALSWAFSTILVKRWRAELAADVLSLTTWQMLFGLVPLIVIAALVPERATDWTPSFGAIIGFMAVVSTAFGWFLWLYVLERLPAWQASLSILGIPGVAIVSSRWQLGEQADSAEIAGMLLIGAGLVAISLMNWRAQRRVARQDAA